MSLVQREDENRGHVGNARPGDEKVAPRPQPTKDNSNFYWAVGAGLGTLALLVLLPVALLSMGPPPKRPKPVAIPEVAQVPSTPVEKAVTPALVSFRPVEAPKAVTVVEPVPAPESPQMGPGYVVTAPPAEFAMLEEKNRTSDTQVTKVDWAKKYYTLPEVTTRSDVGETTKTAGSSFIPAQPLPGQTFTPATQGGFTYGFTTVTQLVPQPVLVPQFVPVPVTQYVPVPVYVPVPQYIPYQQNIALTSLTPGPGVVPNKFTLPGPNGGPTMTVPGYGGGKPALVMNGGGGIFNLTVPGQIFGKQNLVVPQFGGNKQNLVVPHFGGGKQNLVVPNNGGNQNLTIPNFGGTQNLTIPHFGGGKQNLTIPNFGGGKQTVMTPPPFGGQQTVMNPPQFGGKQNIMTPNSGGCKQTIIVINQGCGGNNNFSIPRSSGMTGNMGRGCYKK